MVNFSFNFPNNKTTFGISGVIKSINCVYLNNFLKLSFLQLVLHSCNVAKKLFAHFVILNRNKISIFRFERKVQKKCLVISFSSIKTSFN